MDAAAARLASLSEAYRASVQPSHWGGQGRRTAARDAAFFLPHLRPGMHVLDAGCGVGMITRGLAAAVQGGDSPTGVAVGVDANGAALVRAREGVALAGPPVEFVEADIYQLPFPDASFDAVFSHGVVQHLTRPIEALREFRRVLRPGGVVGLADAEHDSRVLWPAPPALLRAVELMDRLWATDSGWTFPERAGSDVRVGRRLRELLHLAGFRDATASVKPVCDGSPEATRGAGEHEAHLLEEPALIDYVEALEWASRHDLAEMAEAWRCWGRDPGAFRAKLGCEVLAWA